MAPIEVASLASLVGVFMVLDSRAADRRLVLAGERRAALVASRPVLVFVATGVAAAVSLAVTATVFQPLQWGVYAAGVVLVAVTYALIGTLLAPHFGRVSGVFLAFLIPFLDLGLGRAPCCEESQKAGRSGFPGTAPSVSSSTAL